MAKRRNTRVKPIGPIGQPSFELHVAKAERQLQQAKEVCWTDGEWMGQGVVVGGVGLGRARVLARK